MSVNVTVTVTGRLGEALARHLYAEARDETVESLEALAAAAMNRARGGGSSIEVGDNGVAVNDGDPVFAMCRRIATRAVNGTLRDPIGGATRHHPAHAHPPWAWRKVPLAEVGGHVFYGDEE